jgi:cysteine sulfinate desulfinase/cysteine desulfurase-like protein
MLFSSASEANTTIVVGHINKFETVRLPIAEDVHDSIWNAVKKQPKSIKVLRLQGDGSINKPAFEKGLNDGITMVCLSRVCHETGVIHPVRSWRICVFGVRSGC